MFAKGHDGQEGDLGQAHKVQIWSWVEFLLLQQGRIVIHASEEKAEGERKQERGTAEAVCGAGHFPKELSLLEQLQNHS